ncbi:cobyrinic acid a,c-diamide synthase [Amylibacter marinus]|uniref:Cobyrinic acid a,c-diamide synthase n=2 Tax=Amylibacter marinus TaxID=1475483 RepID=A0ABQ5VRI4_9RHOB|nr:cobyrinic acid a,c-diamide synthase [Amylibacter marinus]
MAASDGTCINLDAWAMSPPRIQSLAQGNVPLIVEGAMGLFDGAPPIGQGSTANLARILNLPVVLVLDVASQAQSVAAVAAGFANHDPAVKIAGLILNKVGSPRHETMLRRALEPLEIPVLGALYRTKTLNMPSRHLGLVQAAEHADLDLFLNQAARLVSDAVDLDALMALMQPTKCADVAQPPLAPPAQNIAVASDAAFAFAYPHILRDWRDAGATLSFFSPLADQAPVPDADLVFLPGGYPELHAARLASNSAFLSGVRNAASVYGECGGYMAMGQGLIDADGTRHQMLGLLDLETSFETRKLHLGYRRLSPYGFWQGDLMGHEFHYATTLRARGQPLFAAKDAENSSLGDIGLINGHYAGSFAHIIDRQSHDSTDTNR